MQTDRHAQPWLDRCGRGGGRQSTPEVRRRRSDRLSTQRPTAQRPPRSSATPQLLPVGPNGESSAAPLRWTRCDALPYQPGIVCQRRRRESNPGHSSRTGVAGTPPDTTGDDADRPADLTGRTTVMRGWRSGLGFVRRGSMLACECRVEVAFPGHLSACVVAFWAAMLGGCWTDRTAARESTRRW